MSRTHKVWNTIITAFIAICMGLSLAVPILNGADNGSGSTATTSISASRAVKKTTEVATQSNESTASQSAMTADAPAATIVSSHEATAQQGFVSTVAYRKTAPRRRAPARRRTPARRAPARRSAHRRAPAGNRPRREGYFHGEFCAARRRGTKTIDAKNGKVLTCKIARGGRYRWAQ